MVQVHGYRYKYPGSGTGTAECQQKQIMVQVLWFWYRYSRVPAKTDHGTGALVLVQVHEGASRRSRRDRSSYRYTGTGGTKSWACDILFYLRDIETTRKRFSDKKKFRKMLRPWCLNGVAAIVYRHNAIIKKCCSEITLSRQCC